MSDPVVVSGVRAAIAAGIATHSVVWHQYPNSSYSADTGASGAAVDTTVLVLLYDHKHVEDDAGTDNETVEGIVILDDLPHAITKTDGFDWGGEWRISERSPDPTNSILEFKAKR